MFRNFFLTKYTTKLARSYVTNLKLPATIKIKENFIEDLRRSNVKQQYLTVKTQKFYTRLIYTRLRYNYSNSLELITNKDFVYTGVRMIHEYKTYRNSVKQGSWNHLLENLYQDTNPISNLNLNVITKENLETIMYEIELLQMIDKTFKHEFQTFVTAFIKKYNIVK